jgi:hypothetical protein
MTLALAWNLKDYAIVAADTRLAQYQPDGSVVNDDTFEKVVEAPVGLVTGAGTVQVLGRMMLHLQSMPVEALPGLYPRLVEIEREVVGALAPDTPGLHHTAFTGLILASALGGQSVGVTLMASPDSFQPQFIPPGRMATLMPDLGTAEMLQPYEIKVMESARRLDRFGSVGDSIDYHTDVLTAFMKRACIVCDGFSQRGMFGIIHANGSRRILGMFDLSHFPEPPLEL